MSKALMLAVWDCDLPHPEKTVLAALAYNGQDDGSDIWPSLETVARRAGYKRRQVHNIMTRLKQRGILHVQGRMSRRRGFVTVYSIDLTNVPTLPNPESLQSLHTINGKHDASNPLAADSVQSAQGSVQSEPDSVQCATGKCALAIAQEKYGTVIEKKRIVAPDFSISDSQKQPQEQEPNFALSGITKALVAFKQIPGDSSPLNDEEAYNRRMAELKAQAKRAQEIAEAAKQKSPNGS